ncbi:hypothetical protein BGZ61DRAFT_529465 [Ilyonectria robusta]|uniref:uncharacterized protein n=1 Tax=Ilyonectria robusta TaxID=1079257 RepID=UPI001E8DB508|nr:uncharacterized protein BGZ61DRAFT_529465 [Ilyonectria robusta]KAH8729222.1 hypothetical protein BGZ61DRAFT_529465 [Ilyonectria robusta]
MLVDSIRHWCALCRFHYEPGDELVVLNRYDRLTKKFKYHDKLMIPPLGQHGADDYIYRPNLSDAPLRGGEFVATGLHVGCLALVDRFPYQLSETLQAVAYEYVPSLAEIERRRRWMRFKFTQDLTSSIPKLVGDILYNVVPHCLPSLTLAYLQSAAQSLDKPPGRISVRASRDIWVQRVMFEGLDYIGAVSNTSPPEEEKTKRGHAQLKRPVGRMDMVYVAHDHIGIRKIFLWDSTKVLEMPRCPGLWWVAIPVGKGGSLHCFTDGVKLRKVTCTSFMNGSASKPCDKRWAVPQSPRNNFRWVQIHQATPAISRMDFFQCNHPDIQAYSAAWDDGRLLTLHAHTSAAGDFDAYRTRVEQHNPKVFWFYMPMDPGELIAEIWAHAETKTRFPSYIVIMKTTRGRIWAIGPQPRTIKIPEWRLLDRPRKTPSRIFFEENWIGSTKMAFETPEPVKIGAYYPVVIPRSPYPRLTKEQLAIEVAVESKCIFNAQERPKVKEDRIMEREYFYSSAPLTGVVRVLPCRSSCNGESAIVGLLLQYKDGRRRTVGRVQLNSLDPAIEVDSSTERIMYRLSKDKRMMLQVKAFEHDPGSEWTAVPQSGNLGWWLMSRWSIMCDVFHESD